MQRIYATNIMLQELLPRRHRHLRLKLEEATTMDACAPMGRRQHGTTSDDGRGWRQPQDDAAQSKGHRRRERERERTGGKRAAEHLLAGDVVGASGRLRKKHEGMWYSKKQKAWLSLFKKIKMRAPEAVVSPGHVTHAQGDQRS